MDTRTRLGIAGVSLLGIASSSVIAQANSMAAESRSAGPALEEIVVTARRREESLQDVPQTVDVVAADTVQKLNILKFEDIQAVVPGLALGSNNDPIVGSAASMRGVSFEARTGTTSTVEFYLNEAPIESNALFQSIFDIGQIEVLRGPQGTLRGRASPSGAITVTTRKPDLQSFGASAMASGTDRSAYNLQAALNMPILSNVLAVRFAGLYDDSEYDGIRSIHSNIEPRNISRAGRVSLAFQPVDGLQASVMYQHQQRDLRNYVPVTGSGSAGQAGGLSGRRFPYPFNPTLGANYNGPALTADDRLSVQDQPSFAEQKYDLVDGTIDWRFAGQRLSYVGGYREELTHRGLSNDAGNVLTGVELFTTTDATVIQKSHELRLSSEERVLGRFDYTVGAFYSKFVSAPLRASQGAAYLPGAFGSPFGTPSVTSLDPRYALRVLVDLDSVIEETSAFASLTWHIDDATELTAGGRYISSKVDNATALTVTPGLAALPPQAINPALTACPPGIGTTYPGTCDVPVPAQPLSPILDHRKDNPFVYNVQLSHHFTDGLMAYANVGSSWRHGVSVLGIFNADNDPLINSLTNLPPEKSTSYELGLKSVFLDNRARVDVAVYHQDFKGLLFVSTQPIVYLENRGAGVDQTAFQFVDSADAVVDGIDLDAALQITPHWSASFSASYANGHVKDDTIPCNDPGVTLTPTRRVALCKSNETVSAAPPWTATLQSEYSLPVRATMDAYLRGLYTFYARNSKQAFYQAPGYGLLNLYLGIRAPNGGWELSAFAKNVTNVNKTVGIDSSLGQFEDSALLATGYFPQPGYLPIRLTPWREFGLQVRYAFGSR